MTVQHWVQEVALVLVFVLVVAALGFVRVGCSRKPPDPSLAELCERHAPDCEVDAGTLEDLRGGWHAGAGG